MKKIYTLLALFAFFAVSNVYAQTLYTNTTQVGYRYNPGLGLGNTPKIVFDDINIDNALIADGDSIGFTNLKVAIRQLAGAPAVTVKVYLTGVDPNANTYFTLDSFPAVPPTLIGTFNLTAAAASRLQILSVGDSINVFKALARDTSNIFGGFQTAFVGVSFSNADGLNGWRFTSDGANYDGVWEYNADSTIKSSSYAFGNSVDPVNNPMATFYVEAFGRPVYASTPNDAQVSNIIAPNAITCFSTPQTTGVQITNLGDNTIAPGAASVTLHVGGANTYSATLTNSTSIPKNGTETINFTGISLSNPGVSFDTAFVTLAADQRSTNDTLTTGSITAETISTFPAVEDVETTLPVMAFLSTISGSRQLWSTNPFWPGAYGNPDLTDSLYPHGGTDMFVFDAYSGANSAGTQNRLFSNCITLNHTDNNTSNNLTFFMSHDKSFNTSRDSLYVSISTDKGQTWNRIAGFARIDSAFAFPDWSQETVDLSAYGCQTIQIGFEGVSNYGNVIGLDDVSINSTGTGSCATPVTLFSFTAEKLSKSNKLTWKTSQEINTAKFQIQVSRDGLEYTQLGELAAAGNSNTEKTYIFSHNQPAKGYNYYRIKMVDIDGRFTYSPVRRLQNLGVNEISSYPNPVKGNMQVAINAEKNDVATIKIIDMNGRTVYAKVYNVAEGENNFTVNVAGFTAGNYVLKVQLSSDVVVKKFTKL